MSGERAGICGRHSAGLGERDVVEVRGFPLDAFRATNVGTVVSLHDHDDDGDWDHEDFVIDALLSSGNSGSPVLAVSCATGEYELVGIFHAGYITLEGRRVVSAADRSQLRKLYRIDYTSDSGVAPGNAVDDGPMLVIE